VEHTPYLESAPKSAAREAAQLQQREADKALAEAHLLSVMEERSGRAVLARVRKLIAGKLSDGVTAVDARAHYERCASQLLRELDDVLATVPGTLRDQMHEENHQ
jgi:hypothetical protein